MLKTRVLNERSRSAFENSVASNDDAWNSHDWTRRRIEIEPGKPLLHHRCTRCRRDFVEEVSSGERYAVHVSAFRFDRLSDEITARWLSEPCPKSQTASDEDDRTRFHSAGTPGAATGRGNRAGKK
jgi:hypothetical protein